MSSINQLLNHCNLQGEAREALRTILQEFRQELAHTRAKLDADATVTDTNYASSAASQSFAVKE